MGRTYAANPSKDSKGQYWGGKYACRGFAYGFFSVISVFLFYSLAVRLLTQLGLRVLSRLGTTYRKL